MTVRQDLVASLIMVARAVALGCVVGLALVAFCAAFVVGVRLAAVLL